MTKIEALLRRLLLLRATSPDDKALVFSQWSAALELVRRGGGDDAGDGGCVIRVWGWRWCFLQPSVALVRRGVA